MKRKKLCGLLVTALIMAIGAAAPAAFAREKPYQKPDDSWISLTGTVASASPTSFLLDYGEGLITVEMDDWDWYGEGRNIIEGSEVTVYGEIDRDFWEMTKIEAASVYVDNLNTYFYASTADEETIGDKVTATITELPGQDWMDVRGVVSSVDDRVFTLDTGQGKIKVDTFPMPYNPMDDLGYQKIEEGERVKVFGELEPSLFDENKMLAEVVITLEEDRQKSAQESWWPF